MRSSLVCPRLGVAVEPRRLARGQTFRSRAVVLAPAVVVLALSLLAQATPARASGPATVTVRVEGLAETKLLPTQVTTTNTPVVKDGNPAHSCPGISAAGALQLATSGNWSGAWFSGLGYTVERIASESHLFEAGAPANYFWSFWLDNKPASTGVCGAELNPGDSILLFPECFSEVGACPPSPNPLGIEARPSVNVGEPFQVTVTRYNAKGEASAANGAVVTGAEKVTDASGHASVCVSSPGELTLQATAHDAVRTETTVSVHAGSGASCPRASTPSSTTTTTTTSTTTTKANPTSTAIYSGPYAIVAHITGVADGHAYGRGSRLRLLHGMVDLHSPLREVKLRLTRRQGRKCAFYDGATERFHAMRCGAVHGSFFSVGAHASFSYLLPAALSPGRYVLDVEASDTAGNHTRLARGSSRFVFYVR